MIEQLVAQHLLEPPIFALVLMTRALCAGRRATQAGCDKTGGPQ